MKKFIIFSLITIELLFYSLYAYSKCFNISGYQVCVRNDYELRQKIKNVKDELRNLKMQIEDYIMEHKIATVCLLSAGVTTVTYLNKDKDIIDDPKMRSVLALTDVACVIYTIANYDEVAKVTTQLSKFGVKYKFLIDELDVFESELDN